MAYQSIERGSSGTSINTNTRTVYKDGRTIPFPDGVKGNNVVVLNNHVMVDGYKLMPDGKWINVKEMSKSKNLFKRLLRKFKGE